ncbi:MAG: hypothetical protein R3335_11790 [Anaerolineales bacterium]|nr:hypothetical protein [Anaerolineales bacterium]
MIANSTLRIGLVGPCAAGKSTLAQGLDDAGYEVRQIAQEHSYVADMWYQIGKPDVLIYLDVSHATSIARRPQNFNRKEYDVQLDRLRHARQHADLIIDTNNLSIEDVLKRTLSFLDQRLA